MDIKKILLYKELTHKLLQLEMIAVLRSQPSEDILEDISNCSGKGELFWPFIKLEQFPPLEKEESLPLPKSLSSTLKHRKV